jgi:type I restriction enzyme S subunit
MEANRLVPKLRFPEFEGSWIENRLSGLFSEFKSGQNITSSNIHKVDKYPVYGGNGIRGFTESYTHDGVYFLIGRQGALCGNINWSEGQAFFSEHAIACRGNEKNDTKWLAQRLAYYNLNRLSESSAQPGLSVSKLLRFKIWVPTLPEQQKIATFLTSVDKRIQLLQSKKEHLEAYKKGVMQKIFSQEIRFKITNKDGELVEPPDWEEKKLGEIGEIINGLTYSPKEINSEGVLVLRSSNVKDGIIVLKDNVFVKTKKFNPVLDNDILICVRNGSKRLIGKNALITKNHVGLAFGAFMTIYRSQLNQYLFHWFSTPTYKKEVHKNLGATINSINGSDLKKFIVPVPCNEEQQKIANFLSVIDESIEKVGIEITATQTYKKGLLQKMFV